jgi:hypothetical protein
MAKNTGPRSNRAQIPILTDATLRRLAIIGGAGVVACVVSRAPTILQEIKIPVIDVKLAVNAGYILVLGPLCIFLAVLAVWYATPRTGVTGVWTARDRDIARALFVLPSIAAAFLSLQFFLLLAPPGACTTFKRWRYVTDYHLEAFRPEYCMGLPPETQSRMPWLLEPPIVQGWFQVAAPIAVGVLLIMAWRSWSPRIPRGAI